MDRRQSLTALAGSIFLMAFTPQNARNRQPPPTKMVGRGDVIYRKEMTEPLPNAFGRADLFGRKRTTGFIELRYQGLTPEGKVVVRRTDISVLSNETTFTAPSPFGSGGSTTGGDSVFGNSVTVNVQAPTAPQPMQMLPPGVTDITIDLAGDRSFIVNGELFEVVEASENRATIRGPILQR